MEINASEGWGSWDGRRTTAQQAGHPGSSLGLSFLLHQAKVTAGKRLHVLRELKPPDSVQSCLPHFRGWASVSLSPHLCTAKPGRSRTANRRRKPGASKGEEHGEPGSGPDLPRTSSLLLGLRLAGCMKDGFLGSHTQQTFRQAPQQEEPKAPSSGCSQPPRRLDREQHVDAKRGARAGLSELSARSSASILHVNLQPGGRGRGVFGRISEKFLLARLEAIPETRDLIALSWLEKVHLLV